MSISEKEKWSKDVQTAHSAVALFTRDPETIAASLASKEYSPGGPASGMRMLSFYISRSGKRLSPSRLRNLEKAKRLLLARVEQAQRDEARRHSR